MEFVLTYIAMMAFLTILILYIIQKLAKLNERSSSILEDITWCGHHNLKYCETFDEPDQRYTWWGEDEQGNKFVPGKDGEPFKIGVKQDDYSAHSSSELPSPSGDE